MLELAIGLACGVLVAIALPYGVLAASRLRRRRRAQQYREHNNKGYGRVPCWCVSCRAWRRRFLA